jgi:hypothetical protein
LKLSRLDPVAEVRKPLTFPVCSRLFPQLSLPVIYIHRELPVEMVRYVAAGEGHEHLPLLDNINWKSISQILGTRNENMAGIMSVNSYQSVPHNDAFDASAHEARTTKQVHVDR